MKKWILLIVLSLIWGSSFILMKKILIDLSPVELGFQRIFWSTLILLVISWKHLKGNSAKTWKYFAYTGFLGTGVPVFMFALAVDQIDSGVASILNGLVPIFALILGVLYFGVRGTWLKAVAIVVGFVGTALLISEVETPDGSWVNPYAFLVLIAAICYALNVNMIKNHLGHAHPRAIASGGLLLIFPLVCLVYGCAKPEGAPFLFLENTQTMWYLLLLSGVCTALAKIVYNALIASSDAIFSSSVTYLIPLVAVGWGLLDGETLTLFQGLAFSLIVGSIVLVNFTRREKSL